MHIDIVIIMGSNGKITIGFLVGYVDRCAPYQWRLFEGIANAAKRRNANIISFAGGSLYSGKFVHTIDEYEKNANLLYNFVSKKSVDGLILSSEL